MNEAIHSIDGGTFRLPPNASLEETRNLKKLAEKGLYKCPYCEAKLFIKSGEDREIHFSHYHSEACEPSRVFDKAENKYSKQILRETSVHRVMVDIIHDELKTQARTRMDLSVDYGYKAKPNLTSFPDVWVKLGENEFAISVVTNVKPSSDDKLSKEIVKRHQYFMNNGLRPLWFIERKEWSVEIEKHSIVLWDAESVIASYTPEDKKWEALLRPIAKDHSFFNRFNYPFSLTKVNINVRSMYYIYSTEERIVVKVQRFIKDRVMKPFRAFLLNDGYEIPFSKALYNFQLGDLGIEEQERIEFLKKFEELGKKLLEIQIEEQNKEEHVNESIVSQSPNFSSSRGNSPRPTTEEKWGHCIFCGQYTNNWWMFDGVTNTCRCKECRSLGKA